MNETNDINSPVYIEPLLKRLENEVRAVHRLVERVKQLRSLANNGNGCVEFTAVDSIAERLQALRQSVEVAQKTVDQVLRLTSDQLRDASEMKVSGEKK